MNYSDADLAEMGITKTPTGFILGADEQTVEQRMVAYASKLWELDDAELDRRIRVFEDAVAARIILRLRYEFSGMLRILLAERGLRTWRT